MILRRLASVAWEGLLLELALYRSLVRWIVRRPDVPEGATALGYARLVGPMLWLWIFGSATETVVVEVVLRQVDAGWAHAIRLPLLVIGIWGVLWMVGLMASYRVRPHLLTDGLLRIRCGARTWVDVPLDAIDSVRSAGHDYEGILKSMVLTDDLLLVGVSNATNLELVLTGPTDLRTSKGERRAGRVGLWVDDPRATAAQLRDRFAARA